MKRGQKGRFSSKDGIKTYNKSHKEWRNALIERDKGCVICGKLKYANAHHIIPENFEEFRWEVDNGIMLCPKHHSMGRYSAHKHSIWWIKWLKENRLGTLELAQDRMEDLQPKTGHFLGGWHE